MSKLLAPVLSLLIACAPVQAKAWTHGSAVVRTQVNITQAPYNATCNGVADDTAAILAGRAALQGNTPVTVTVPSGKNCMFNPTPGDGLFPFKGIGNLIVSGYGATWTNSSSTQPMLFGGQGEIGNNQNSVRFQTASAGASCITLVTQPQTNISNVVQSFAEPALFTASLSAGVLSVSAVSSGAVAVGQFVAGSPGGAGGVITALLTGPGGAGSTYSITGSGSASSRSFAAAVATFTGSVSGNTLTVTVSPAGTGTIAVGQRLYGLTNSTEVGTTITALGTGTGGAGTYTIDTAQTLASQTMATGGVPRLTIASGTGYADGDTVFVQGVTGTGQLPNKSNGLWWARKPDSTHLDLFQSDWDGGSAYGGGGTVGGDRTPAVGSKVLVSGFVLQVYWMNPFGFPSNQHWFEYKTVASVNSGTHQVCFDAPLKYTYKSTWPQYNTGNAFNIDAGGPATMYVLDPSWETTQEYQGLTLFNGNFQNVSNGRSIKFTDVTTTDVLGFVPSQNESYTWLRVSAVNVDTEIDKLIGTLTLASSTIKKMTFQSSSTDSFVVTNTTFTKQLVGTPKSFTGTNATFSGTGLGGSAALTLGTSSYGATTGASSCTNCNIANDIDTQAVLHAVNACWSFGGTGIITIPNSCNTTTNEFQLRWAVPGANFFIGNGAVSGLGNYAMGQVLDVTQDLTNTYVTTSFTSGFPASPSSAGITQVFPHPAPSLTMTGSFGNATAVSFAGCSAGLPMFSCQTRAYTGSATGTTAAPTFAMWGTFASLTMNVSTPYAGAGALTWTLSQSGNWDFVRQSDATVRSYASGYGGGPTVNMKLGGTRTITQSATTGAQAGDTLNSTAEADWLGGQSHSGPVFSATTPSDSPVVQTQMLTNQGVVFPYLLRRDIDRSLPANDNRPMFLNAAA